MVEQTLDSGITAPVGLRPLPRRGAFRAVLERVFPDPRIPVLLLLAGYLLLGFTTLGWNRSPMQVLVTSASACVLELFLGRLFGRKLEFPLSALITSLG